MSEAQQPTFSIEKIYVKDLSLEVPGGPQTFMQSEQPQLEIQIAHQSQRVNEVLFEVTLGVTVTAKLGDKTAFLVEVSQAGVFQIRNVAEADLAPLYAVLEGVFLGALSKAFEIGRASCRERVCLVV